MASPEEKIQEEIKKANDWYQQKYRKTFEVHQRYDKEEQKFSWRLIARIGGKDRMLPFGVTEKIMNTPLMIDQIIPKIGPHIRAVLTKAQTKWEPHILAMKVNQ